MNINRKDFFKLVGVSSAAALLSACSTGSKNDTASTGGAYVSPVQDSAFPRTITTAFGTTTIEKKPERIVALTHLNGDLLLSLGVVPVACAQAGWGANSRGSFDWTEQALHDLGASTPASFDDSDGIDFSAVAAHNPDLIVMTYGKLSEEEYTKLSALAPVVCFEGGGNNYTTVWQDSIRILGTALGLEEQADEVVKETTHALQNVSQQYPQVKDSTFIATYLDPTSDSVVNLYGPGDNRTSFFESLGMAEAPVYNDLKFTQDSFYMPISNERADQLTGDMLFTWTTDADQGEQVTKNSTVQSIPVVGKGGLFMVNDHQQVTAMGTSPIAMSWLLAQDFITNLAEVLEVSKKDQGQ